MFMLVEQVKQRCRKDLGVGSTLDGYSSKSKNLQAVEGKLFFSPFILLSGLINLSTLVELLKRSHFHVYLSQME